MKRYDLESYQRDEDSNNYDAAYGNDRLYRHVTYHVVTSFSTDK